MRPAYSVIFFTTASGAGYGLLIWLALLAAMRGAALPPLPGFVALALALALITAGLLASMAHLGRPERAWRALSQWRTSWLSREGLFAVLTYLPAGVLGLGWLAALLGYGSLPAVPLAIAAGLAVMGALVTLWCTGMIYASLPAIPAWRQPLVAPLYIVLALATGGVLAAGLLLAFGLEARHVAAASLVALVAGGVMKLAYWRAIGDGRTTVTPGEATGLGRFGTVRQLDPPHTQANFVMREMGYSVARRHALRLRRIALLLLFALPALMMLVVLTGWFALPAAALAILSAAAGVLVERWLFFAEAQHMVVAYYSR